MESTPVPRLLFDPPPGALRFFVPSPFAESVVVGAGVELDSEALSLASEGFNVVASSTAGAGEEPAEAVDCSSDLGVGSWKRRSILGDSLSMAILVCFFVLSALGREAEGDLPGVVEDETGMVGVVVLFLEVGQGWGEASRNRCCQQWSSFFGWFRCWNLAGRLELFDCGVRGP